VRRVALAGSERDVAGATRAGDVDPDRHAVVSVVLADRSDAALDAVRHFAREHGLGIVEASLPRRTVRLGGTLAQLQAAFGVELGLYDHPELGRFRGRSSPVHLPADVEPHVQAVLGLDDRPVARTQLRRAPARPHAATTSFTPRDLAALYGFPDGAGAGETVAVIELGGAYAAADLTAYWEAMGVTPAPRVSTVLVDGATAVSDGPDGADGEVMLDIEVIGAVAPEAEIVVYFAPNTDDGFLDAITTAAQDPTHRPGVISISWGGPESAWTPQSLRAYDRAFADAGEAGVTVFAASGDNGSGDGATDGRSHVDFPASSPHVVACGGTKLTADGGAIAAEVVWNEPGHGAGGGGVSEAFPVPGYQAAIAGLPLHADTRRPGRVVPDVAGDADPLTGYVVRVDGETTVIGGTSAVAPLWSGLIARVNALLGRRVGDVHAALYAAGMQRDITEGSNGAYGAAPGFDACTGLGSPDGAKVMAALGGGAAPTGGAGGAAPDADHALATALRAWLEAKQL
jgi:kumamolisin